MLFFLGQNKCYLTIISISPKSEVPSQLLPPQIAYRDMQYLLFPSQNLTVLFNKFKNESTQQNDYSVNLASSKYFDTDKLQILEIPN